MVRLGRRLLRIISLIFMAPAAFFGATVIVVASDYFGFAFFRSVSRFFMNDPWGLLVFITLGISAVVFLASTVLKVVENERLRRLRYDILNYLIANRKLTGKRIHFWDLARSMERDPYDLELCLKVLVLRGEVKGRIDRKNDIYQHSSVTKKGLMVSKMSSYSDRYGAQAAMKNMKNKKVPRVR